MDIKAFIWESCMHMATYFALASDSCLRVAGWNGSGKENTTLHTLHRAHF